MEGSRGYFVQWGRSLASRQIGDWMILLMARFRHQARDRMTP